MPVKPGRPCKERACPHLSHDGTGYCPEHLKQARRVADAGRGNASERGYTARWHKARTVYLNENPLCVHCLKEQPPRYTPASVVDHIIPHRGDYNLMWDEGNWQPLCAYHHNVKTATEDGAFGHKKR